HEAQSPPPSRTPPSAMLESQLSRFVNPPHESASARFGIRSPSPMARSASGRRSASSGPRPVSNDAGCIRHKTANILNKLPKSQQPNAKRTLQDIWMAETRKDAEAAFDVFVETYGVKYEKAAECLKKDRGPLLAFYDFPAEHWKHLRTSNPIESTFATVRHRTIRSKGCLSNKTALAMVFKLVGSGPETPPAPGRSRLLNGQDRGQPAAVRSGSRRSGLSP